MGPPRPHDDHGVGPLDIRPAGRDRTNTLVPEPSEENPVLPPVVGEADQLEALAEEGVEGMDDYESTRNVTTGCS